MNRNLKMAKVNIKLGAVEFYAEGTGKFVVREKIDFYEKWKSEFFGKISQINTETQKKEESPVTMPMALREFEQKNQISQKTSRLDLTRNVVLWMKKCKKMDSFKKHEFVEAIKESTFYKKTTHEKNLSPILKALVKANILIEKEKNLFTILS